jgi:hypothetical protein
LVDKQKVPNKVQPTDTVVTDTADMGNSNVIPYEQYVNNNKFSVVPICAPSVVDNTCELHEHTVFIPDDTLSTRLNNLKDQVNLYEQCAKLNLMYVSRKWISKCVHTYQNVTLRKKH